MTMLRLAPTLGLLSSLLAAGCFGTEGGNPLDPDAGYSTPDGSPCTEDAAAAAPVCDRAGTLPAECTCAAEAPVPLATAPRGYGMGSSLIGPTASGGFVALHGLPCTDDCVGESNTYTLSVHRFDAAGHPAGAPIELTRSAGPWQGVPVDGAALADGETLAVVFGDTRGLAPRTADLWFAKIDLASGAWIVEPRLAFEAQRPLLRVHLARTAGGFGVVYTDEHGGADPGAYFLRLDDGGSVAAGPVRLTAPRDPMQVSLAPRGDGFALGRMSGTSALFVALTADGAEAAPPVTIGTTSGSWLFGPILRPSGSGYVAGWSDAAGAYLTRLDASGAATSSPTVIPRALLIDVVVEVSGVVATSWSPRPCQGAAVGDVFLTRIDASGAPLHPDVIVHHDHMGSQTGGVLVDTADGLRASVTTTLTDQSTTWIVPACAPLAP